MESKNTNHRPVKSLLTPSNKDNYFRVQTKQYYDYLHSRIATNSMVSKATGIPQKNLTRYKRTLEEMGLLFEVYKGICEHTKHRATYLTTNKDLIK